MNYHNNKKNERKNSNVTLDVLIVSLLLLLKTGTDTQTHRRSDPEKTNRVASTMILTGRTLCLPSPATVQEVFLVARDARILPDISLDPVLTTFLSLDSPAALRHQYTFLQRSLNAEQQAAFSHNLTHRLGGSTKVTYGGVGVVALALSLIFDQVSQQVGKMSLHNSKTTIYFMC